MSGQLSVCLSVCLLSVPWPSFSTQELRTDVYKKTHIYIYVYILYISFICIYVYTSARCATEAQPTTSKFISLQSVLRKHVLLRLEMRICC
jgi:hypothetical protein